MSDLDPEQLRKWAVSGAEQRLLAIASEAALIYRTFPELRDRAAKGRPAGGAARRSAAAGAGAAQPAGRGRRTMSAAARKRISDAQKKRWAAQRKA